MKTMPKKDQGINLAKQGVSILDKEIKKGVGQKQRGQQDRGIRNHSTHP